MSAPWMPFYVADYLAATRRLSTLEHGCYLLLIMEYWQHGGLPTADHRLARIVQLSDREWAKVRPILRSFFDEGWRHKRIDAELAKSAAKTERRIESGRNGGLAKASNARNLLEQNSQQNSSNALASSSQPQSSNDDTSLRSVSRDARQPAKRSTRLTADWSPSPDDLEYARDQGLSESQIGREAENFRDFWLAKSGANGTKNDWAATWRTWVRRSLDSATNARAGPQRSARGPSMAEMARMDEPGFSFDDPRSDPRHSPTESAGRSDPRPSGLAGHLPVEADAHAGRRLVDL